MNSFIYDEETKRVARLASAIVERLIIRGEEKFGWIKDVAAIAAIPDNVGNCATLVVRDIIAECRATAIDVGAVNGPDAEATAAAMIRVIEKLPYLGGVLIDPRGEKEDRARARAMISRVLNSVED